ncbi:conserved hypothetical protein [Ricinus communis]|uniref:Uncharacterized protein n=1 Tax=Ricinus communis TaxID=3988 RepID=B9TBU9_RICCO|nr:conserved hypothetical protein [Ricinus communis]
MRESGIVPTAHVAPAKKSRLHKTPCKPCRASSSVGRQTCKAAPDAVLHFFTRLSPQVVATGSDIRHRQRSALATADRTFHPPPQAHPGEHDEDPTAASAGQDPGRPPPDRCGHLLDCTLLHPLGSDARSAAAGRSRHAGRRRGAAAADDGLAGLWLEHALAAPALPTSAALAAPEGGGAAQGPAARYLRYRRTSLTPRLRLPRRCLSRAGRRRPGSSRRR